MTAGLDYWNRACEQIATADPVMARLIRAAADTRPTSRGDPFQTLARSIVGQQISVKAAYAVWMRVVAAAGEVTPARVSRMRLSTLVRTGLSQRKAEYLKDLALHFHSGAVDPSRWPQMDDEAIIAELVEVRGIGRWTVEMLLIFNLMRPDVLPLDDMGVLRAMALSYPERWPPQAVGALTGRIGREARAAARAIAEPWRPWRTVGTWYLWRSLQAVPVGV
uniref:DNA-3-methyladenine glycosylase II n=1 Tax=uncultured Pseudomonadota bacterium TaxID=153809 RepID=R4N1C4_9PROT|nr:HhH-GPD family protein [uncultured proteobacterium]